MSDDTEQKETNSQYDELKRVMDDAAKIKSDINSNCKETLKNMKRDFSEFMFDNMEEDFKRIAERLGLFNGFADVEDKKKREKKENSTLKSFFGKMFSKAKDFEYLKKGGKPKDTTPPKCDTYVMDIIASLYASRLIPEVKRALETAGVEIRFTKPITKLDLDGNEDDQKTIVDYIERGANIQNEIFEKNAEIEDVIFENIPDRMKYSETNPKGIKKAQFSALAELQAKTDELSMNGDAEKASDMVEKQCDKHFENSKNQEMLAIVTELIIAKDEQEKPANYEDALGGTEEDSFGEDEQLEAGTGGGVDETGDNRTNEELEQDAEDARLQEEEWAEQDKELDKLVSEDMD
jgi:hypothetical protein